MVIDDNATTYTAGGVYTTNIRLIDERGPLVSTSNPTDLAILGGGMLPVTTMDDVLSGNASPELMMTRRGPSIPTKTAT